MLGTFESIEWHTVSISNRIVEQQGSFGIGCVDAFATAWQLHECVHWAWYAVVNRLRERGRNSVLVEIFCVYSFSYFTVTVLLLGIPFIHHFTITFFWGVHSLFGSIRSLQSLSDRSLRMKSNQFG